MNTITLTIALAVNVARLGADLPAAGEWAVMSSEPGRCEWRVEASGFAWEACHVTVTVRRDGAGRVYWLRFKREAL